LLGVQPIDAKGVVVGAPRLADGLTWWQVDYVASPDGWTVESALGKAAPAVKPTFEADHEREVTVTFVNRATGQTVATVTALPDAVGDVEPSTVVPSGTYDIYVKADGYLPNKIEQQVVEPGRTIALPTLKAGDLNDDAVVNAIDWSVMNRRWNTSDEVADFNGDGVVNTLDFSFMRQNWNTRGAQQ
jgi:hypothetical protein